MQIGGKSFCWTVGISIWMTPAVNSVFLWVRCFRELGFPACCHFLKEIERDRVYFLLKDLIAVPSQLHLAHCNQTNHGGWWSMIAFRLACLHIALSLFSFLRTPAVAARLWNHGDGGETEGLRSICYHCEIMIAQPLVTGWTLISSLIHVHLIWTVTGHIYLASKKRRSFFSTSSSAPPLSLSLSLYISTLCCAKASCFHLVVFETTCQGSLSPGAGR